MLIILPWGQKLSALFFFIRFCLGWRDIGINVGHIQICLYSLSDKFFGNWPPIQYW
ncbi:hypothetical protein HOLleu_01540 [Holothuria leucospilota]|uniref:Uncharacterized protein n=1 Tax=Holothuria leucospilota TaxID=206669 RepID=A0A9Q1HJA7_HOLLE|nr:hypothetical protein HOLleu_01540 [Holothuria leucospilota]